MAITDYKISGLDPAKERELVSANIRQVHVEMQPTVLKGSTLQNKQVFDAYPNMIVAHFNAALEEIMRVINEGVTIDSAVIEFYQSLGWIPEN